MNHKHVKKCHYRSLQHDFWEQFSKHELHSGDWVQIAKRWHIFSFLFFFLGFRASGITCIWFSIEKMFLEVDFFFLTKNVKIWKIMKKCVYFSRKKEIIYVLQGWRDVLRKTLQFFALWWHFGSQSLVWSVARFHFNFSARPCRLQPMVLWSVRPSVIEKSIQWWQEWILSLCPCLVRPLHCLSLPVLNRADFVLMDRWGTLLRCYTWPKTTLVPDVPFLSVVVRPRSVVKTKSVLIGFSLNRLNRMK